MDINQLRILNLAVMALLFFGSIYLSIDTLLNIKRFNGGARRVAQVLFLLFSTVAFSFAAGSLLAIAFFLGGLDDVTASLLNPIVLVIDIGMSASVAGFILIRRGKI